MESIEQTREHESLNIEQILGTLRGKLPEIAKGLVREDPKFPDLSPEEQERELEYLENPDSPAGHSPRWHQYGFLTHSEKFREFIADEVPAQVEELGIAGMVNDVLSQKIDEVSKGDLLQIASLLHDIGKPVARYLETKEDGTTLARFDKHEERSYDVIMGELHPFLQDLNLTDAQIEYIAQCAKYHFELGKARKAAVEGGDKNSYTMKYARSPEFKAVAQGIIDEHPDYALEIGLMFMADSYSKAEIVAVADNDEEITAQREALKQRIAKEEGLDSKLINQAEQQPVNAEIGKQYLLVWAERKQQQKT